MMREGESPTRNDRLQRPLILCNAICIISVRRNWPVDRCLLARHAVSVRHVQDSGGLGRYAMYLKQAGRVIPTLDV